MKHLLAPVLAVILSPALVWAQQSDSWRGLTLDDSTITDAVEMLGIHKKQKDNEKLRTPVSPWLDDSLRFTKLEFKESEGAEDIQLFFLAGKLRVIQFHLREKLNPNSLPEAYGIGFVPKVSGIDIAFSPENYERHQGKVYPRIYPERYHLIGIAERSFVIAQVKNSFWGRVFHEWAGAPDEVGSFPGEVEAVQIVSRQLRDQSGTEVLK